MVKPILKVGFALLALSSLILGFSASAEVKNNNQHQITLIAQANGDQVSRVSSLPMNNYSMSTDIGSYVCKLLGSPMTCMPIVNFSPLPISIDFTESDVGKVNLNQIGFYVFQNKNEEHATQHVVVSSPVGQIYEGDIQNNVGMKMYFEHVQPALSF